MKTENTPANKARFLQQYGKVSGTLSILYGELGNQTVKADLVGIIETHGFYDCYDKKGNKCNMPRHMQSVELFTGDFRSIESLTHEKTTILAKIMDISYSSLDDGSYFDLYGFTDWLTGLFKEYQSYSIEPAKLLQTIDYLRSIGILIPYMDLSVEDLIAYGWAKVATN